MHTCSKTFTCLDYWFASCKGAGLVKHHSVNMRRRFQHIATSYEQATPGACNTLKHGRSTASNRTGGQGLAHAVAVAGSGALCPACGGAHEHGGGCGQAQRARACHHQHVGCQLRPRQRCHHGAAGRRAAQLLHHLMTIMQKALNHCSAALQRLKAGHSNGVNLHLLLVKLTWGNRRTPAVDQKRNVTADAAMTPKANLPATCKCRHARPACNVR